MARFYPALLFLLSFLTACSPGSLSPEAPPTLAGEIPSLFPPSSLTSESPTEAILPVSTKEVPPLPKMVATLSTPHIDQGPDGAVTAVPPDLQECAYQWASQDLPELSAEFLQAVGSIQPGAQAKAFAFGEDCVRADGSRTFLAMETDFTVTLSAADLTDKTALGEWIVKVMGVIENLSPDQIVGPRPGRVSLIFTSNGQKQTVNFYVDQYRALAEGLSTAEIYQALQASQ